jgi:hypothetical protein
MATTKRSRTRRGSDPAPSGLYPVPFYCGDGTDAIMLQVRYISDYPKGKSGLCAFCHGDPCAQNSPPDSEIAKYCARTKLAHMRVCPCCRGRQS